MLRIAVALALLAGAVVLTPRPASALPLALGDHAAMSQGLSGSVVEQVARRAHYKRYAHSSAAITGPTIPIGAPISIATGSSTTRMAARCSEQQACQLGGNRARSRYGRVRA